MINFFFSSLLLLLISLNSFAEQVLIVSNNNQSFQQSITSLLKTELEEKQFQVSLLDTQDYSYQNKQTYSIVISIGKSAAKAVINYQLDTPVLSLLISKLDLDTIVEENIDQKNRYLISSIYIDQPIERQLNLISQLSSEFKNIGIIYGERSIFQRIANTHQIEKSGYISNNVFITKKTKLIAETQKIVETADVLLAIPDHNIYNRRSIKGILLTTYRKKIPVIGYSKAYVKAGALAAIYSSAEGISRQTIELIGKIKTNNFSTAILAYPKYFDIAFNRSVAHSLNIQLPRKNDLIRKIQRIEARTSYQPITQGRN